MEVTERDRVLKKEKYSTDAGEMKKKNRTSSN